MADFFASIEFEKDIFKTISWNEFLITGADEKHINIYIPGNPTVKELSLSIDELRKMLESDVEFTQIKDVTEFFGKQYVTQAYSYHIDAENALFVQPELLVLGELADHFIGGCAGCFQLISPHILDDEELHPSAPGSMFSLFP